MGMNGWIDQQIDRTSAQLRIVPIQVMFGFTDELPPLPLMSQVSALGQAAGYDAAEVANALGAGPWLRVGGPKLTQITLLMVESQGCYQRITSGSELSCTLVWDGSSSNF